MGSSGGGHTKKTYDIRAVSSRSGVCGGARVGSIKKKKRMLAV